MNIYSLDQKGIIKSFSGNSFQESEYNILDNENIAEALPGFVKNKALWSLGYPYFIDEFDDKIAVTCDYGILLL